MEKPPVSTPDQDQLPIETPNPSKSTSASTDTSLTRREFLNKVSFTAAAASVAGIPSLFELYNGPAQAATPELAFPTCSTSPGCYIDPQTNSQRVTSAFQVRVSAAEYQRDLPLPAHPCNGDEVLYQGANYYASYTKGLPTINARGEVNPEAYCALLNALAKGTPASFEAIPLGCTIATGNDDATARFGAPNGRPEITQLRLVNPQSALAFDLEGADSHHLAIPPAPTFRSAEEASEMGELYWQALARDIHFSDYDRPTLLPTIKAAVDDLNKFSDFRGPKEPTPSGCRVTPLTLFRGVTNTVNPCNAANNDDLVGPYISQFLLRPIPLGAQLVDPRVLTVQAGIGSDYMTTPASWLAVQAGCSPVQADKLDRRVYIRNGRDLGQYVHIDVLYQAYFNACLILLTNNRGGGLEAPFDDNNPYNNSRTQEGFGTFGGPQLKSVLAEVATRALKAVWFQKWSVHRRLRPEAFGGRIHFVAQGGYDIHPDILNSPVLNTIAARYNGNRFLPQAFPEGSPLHPAYGTGHGTVGGACITVLKAWFKENTLLSDLVDPSTGQAVVPVVASADGSTTVPYLGADRTRLTVRGELNKLASNIAIGRDFAGVHWRSDYREAIKLGEAIAIRLLEDTGFTYNETFAGFSLTKFDGTTVTIGRDR